LVKNIQTHQSPATELFEVLVWPIIITTIDFLLKICAGEYMQITVPFCPQLQPDSLFFSLEHAGELCIIALIEEESYNTHTHTPLS